MLSQVLSFDCKFDVQNINNMSTNWESFYENLVKPLKYDDTINNVQDFIRLHWNTKLVLVTVSA